ncbi:MAG TPA: type II toxin-antitoxin system VapC family toxin [Solirubrobacteraceae bacterium]|nr:type II toxin-antitoxin system VapC family toxin [Solirubrobacteraceae bacterium]
MTVLDTSAVVDYLLDTGVAEPVHELIRHEGELAAPDVLVFEVLAVLRRESHRGVIAEPRAAGAVADLGQLPIQLFPSLFLRRRVWALRGNLTAADALFVALAESLGEPLATKDEALAREAVRHASLDVLRLGARTSEGH